MSGIQSYDRAREIRAEHHNARHNQNWRKTLKELKNFGQKDLENLIHRISSLANSGDKKSLRELSPYILLLSIILGITAVGVAYYLSPKKLSIDEVKVDKTYVNIGDYIESEAKISDPYSANPGVKNATAQFKFPNKTIVSVPAIKTGSDSYKAEVKAEISGEYQVNFTSFDKENFKAEKVGPKVTAGISQEDRERLLNSGMDEKFLDGDFAKWMRDVGKRYANSREILSKTSRILSDIGISSAKRHTLNGFGNYSYALLVYGYPERGVEAYRLFYDTAEKPEGVCLLDFSPAVVSGTLITNGTYNMLIPEKSYVNATELVKFLKEHGWIRGNVQIIKNHSIEIGSENIPRDTWLVVENLNRDPRIAEKPKWYLALNIMAQQNGWDFFDNPEMREYTLKPTDKTVWEIVDPLRNWLFNEDRMGYPLDLPWVSDVNDKKIAYMYLFELPTRVADLDECLKNNEIVYHEDLDAFRYTVKQMPRLYREVSSEYPNGTWTSPVTGNIIPYVNFYYSWITDRGYHGLENMMKQFLGSNIIENEFAPDLDEQYIVKNPDSINTHLSKNFSYWQLIKFIKSYGKAYNAGWDNQAYYPIYAPIAFKTFRIPISRRGVYYEHFIDAPAKYVSGSEGMLFGLSDEVLQPPRDGRFGEFIIYPGNGISLGSPLAGVKLDLVYGQQHPIEPNAKYIELHFQIRGRYIYLFRAGNKS